MKNTTNTPMSNEQFIKACVNSYKSAKKKGYFPFIHLDCSFGQEGKRLACDATKGSFFAIIKKKGLVDGRMLEYSKSYIPCEEEFKTLWKANKKQIKEIFKKNGYFFPFKNNLK
jgi:hypothetical protein